MGRWLKSSWRLFGGRRLFNSWSRRCGAYSMATVNRVNTVYLLLSQLGAALVAVRRFS